MATTGKDQKSAWKAKEAKRVEELRRAKARGFSPPIKPRISAAECPHCINQDGVVHDHRLPTEHDTPEEGTVGFLDHVDVLIARAFSAEGEKVLFADEAVELKRAGERLRPAFNELMRVFVNPVRKSKPSVADYGRERLVSLMVDAFTVGSRATLSKSTEKLAEHEKLRRGRKILATASELRHVEELRILKEELAKGARLWKKFAPDLNARLVEAGLSEVSEKTMRLWKNELSSHIS
jgi:hypothetical protein